MDRCPIHGVEMNPGKYGPVHWIKVEGQEKDTPCGGKEKKQGGYKKDPEEQRRIQRQHSQEMSLRFLSLLITTGQLKDITSELVTKYTNYFEKDLEKKDE